MKVKALISFAGVCSMRKDDEKEIKDKILVKELIKGGFVEEVKEPKKKVIKDES